MIALTHEPVGEGHLTGDLASNATSARHSGIKVHSMPVDLSNPETALGWLDCTDDPQLGVLSTFILRRATYQPLYEAALERGITLIHTPEQTSRLMEFELFYPLIEQWTAKSVVVRDEITLMQAITELEFPVFTKGQIKSVKEAGWDACIAKTPDDLALRAGKWGEVIAREILPLRKAIGGEHFPHHREYRSIWLDGEIIGADYYWDGDDPFGSLTSAEHEQMQDLVHQAAVALRCPFVTVDVGQLVDGSWKVIEIGDPQYSGICHMNRYSCWQKLIDYEATCKS